VHLELDLPVDRDVEFALHVGIAFAGIAEAPGVLLGEDVDGERIAIDCTAFRDHTWGRRHYEGLDRHAWCFGIFPSGRTFHKYLSEFVEWVEPPLFKNFLRLDVGPSEVRIRCFAATGCREQELNPPVEDEFTIPLDGSRGW